MQSSSPPSSFSETSQSQITVRAPTNIALIKYWGKQDKYFNLPLNSSISLTVDITKFFTETTINFLPTPEIIFYLNNKKAKITNRIQQVINTIKIQAEPKLRHKGLCIISNNNFPTAAGMASSASGLAALTFALAKLYQINLTMEELSAIARLGSGSASRSLFGGLVKWEKGEKHENSTSKNLYEKTYWPELRLLVVVLDSRKKKVSSTDAMMRKSDLLMKRSCEVVPENIKSLEFAFMNKDFPKLCEVVMAESDSLHEVINESGVDYLNENSYRMKAMVNFFNMPTVRSAYTFDAGPNVWILIKKSEVNNFLSLILNHFLIQYDKLDLEENFDQGRFKLLQCYAKRKIERIIETQVSNTGPIIKPILEKL
ncbi:hypothetical protein SteCoe_36498 [Stentor coeruleus]|uniref:Diphosphomevalonate decarboxylase n=1 Tax=Stentor coeruleus TaxID=5963 RepID=A0A1R2AQ43_9CILI|nr:hypothetical protein SteCoe_36498 [Stentor coeruleus]